METEKKFEQMNTLEEVIESAEITEDSEEMESTIPNRLQQYHQYWGDCQTAQ